MTTKAASKKAASKKAAKPIRTIDDRLEEALDLVQYHLSEINEGGYWPYAHMPDKIQNVIRACNDFDKAVRAVHKS